MVSHEDQDKLDRATELLRDVIAQHRGEDLRAVAIFTGAIQEIRIGARYLGALLPERRIA